MRPRREGEGEESINESCGVLFRNGRLAWLARSLSSSLLLLVSLLIKWAKTCALPLAMGSGYEVVTQAALHAAPSLPHVATGPDHISIYTTCVNVGQKKHDLKSISLFYNTWFLCQGGAKLRVFQQSDRAEKHST